MHRILSYVQRCTTILPCISEHGSSPFERKPVAITSNFFLHIPSLGADNYLINLVKNVFFFLILKEPILGIGWFVFPYLLSCFMNFYYNFLLLLLLRFWFVLYLTTLNPLFLWRIWRDLKVILKLTSYYMPHFNITTRHCAFPAIIRNMYLLEESSAIWLFATWKCTVSFKLIIVSYASLVFFSHFIHLRLLKMWCTSVCFLLLSCTSPPETLDIGTLMLETITQKSTLKHMLIIIMMTKLILAKCFGLIEIKALYMHYLRKFLPPWKLRVILILIKS